MAWDDVVTREESWFTLDPNGAGTTLLPPLLRSAGGDFDIVQGYFRTIERRARQLYINRGDTIEERYGLNRKDWLHGMVLTLVWPTETRTGKAEVEMQALDVAVSKVIQRIRGPFMDKTHGGRFHEVGDFRTISARPITNPREAVLNGEQVWEIHYSIREQFVG